MRRSLRALAPWLLVAVVGCGSDDPDLTRVPAGALDPRFGTDGIVLTDLGAGQNLLTTVLPLPDGRILVGGSVSDGGFSAALARYDASGTLDPSFGNGGVVIAREMHEPDYVGAELRDLARTSAGDFVALACLGTIAPCDWAVARFSADGVLDRRFGNGGVVILAGDRSPSAVVGTPDGGVVVLGNGHPSEDGGPDYVLWKLTAVGQPDPRFGVGGRVAIDLAEDEGEAVLALPDGRLFVGGCTGEAFTLLQLLPDGTLDASFGRGGVAIYDDRRLAGTISTLALGPRGTIVAGGVVVLGAYEGGAVVRVAADGTLDPSFGDGGIVALAPPHPSLVYDLVTDAEGAVVATLGGPFATLRLTPDGTPDVRYGADGIVTTPVGDFSQSVTIGLAPDGGVLVGGTVVQGGTALFALVRYGGRRR